MNEQNVANIPLVSWVRKKLSGFFHDFSSRSGLLKSIRFAAAKGIVEADVLDMIEGAVQVSDMQVRDIMIPRSQMICVEENQSPDEFLPGIIESSHSRFPVIKETKDDVIGILLAKDLIPLVLEKDKFKIKERVRKAVFIPESKRLNILLKEFRTNRNHMAIVVDEFGGLSGLVTIEDVLEQIVGDIEDEYDIDNTDFIKKVENSNNLIFVVKSITHIDYFNEYFKTNFCEDEFDTIGGLVMQEFGCMPRRNDVVEFGGFEFEVMSADKRRIHLLKVSRSKRL